MALPRRTELRHRRRSGSCIKKHLHRNQVYFLLDYLLGTAEQPETTFVADVEYRDITSEGLLRRRSFKGLTKGAGRAGFASMSDPYPFAASGDRSAPLK